MSEAIYVNLDEVIPTQRDAAKNESMLKYEKILLALQPGKVVLEEPEEGETMRGLLLRFSKTATRLGISKNVEVSRYTYKGKTYAGVLLKSTTTQLPKAKG